jgi:hypothetical protein
MRKPLLAGTCITTTVQAITAEPCGSARPSQERKRKSLCRRRHKLSFLAVAGGERLSSIAPAAAYTGL